MQYAPLMDSRLVHAAATVVSVTSWGMMGVSLIRLGHPGPSFSTSTSVKKVIIWGGGSDGESQGREGQRWVVITCRECRGRGGGGRQYILT